MSMIEFKNTTVEKAFHIVFGDDLESRDPLGRGEVLLSHYTTASSAISIIKGSSLWLTNIRRMNDIHEILYGVELVREYFHEPGKDWRRSFFATAGFPPWEVFAELMGEPLLSLQNETSVTCLSEHPLAGEEGGRLSMWRGYGGDENVALLINPHVFATLTDFLGVYSVKVRYWKLEQLSEMLDRVLSRLLDLGVATLQENAEDIYRYVYHFFSFLPLSLKHPGFAEEREWRVFHSPRAAPNSVLKTQVHNLGGTPQIVKVLELIDFQDRGGPDISLKSLYAGTIVGPSDNQSLIAAAIEHELTNAGIPEDRPITTLSAIPFRRR